MKSSALRILGWLVGLLTIGGAGVALALFLAPERITSLLPLAREGLFHLNTLRDSINRSGPFAPLVFVLVQALQVVAAPVPGEATGVAGGFLFGWSFGFLFSTMGLTLGSCLAFGLSHYFRDWALARLQETTAYRRFNHLVCKGNFILPFLLFLIPGFPKDILCYMIGLSVMPFRIFLFVSTIGRLPGTLMLSFQGANVYQGHVAGFLLLLAFTLAVALPSYLFRRQIIDVLNRLNAQSTGS